MSRRCTHWKHEDDPFPQGGLICGSCAKAETDNLRAKLAAAENAIDALEQRVCDFQAAAMIDVGDQGGPCRVEPKHVEREVTALRARIAALEAACAALAKVVDQADDALALAKDHVIARAHEATTAAALAAARKEVGR